MLVGIYVKNKLSAYIFHTRSSSCRGVNLCSFCCPISAIFLLKALHSIYVWFGCAFICILMVCCMIGISLNLHCEKACINVLLTMVVLDDFLYV